MILGLGETREEIIIALSDLKGLGCHYLTLGQYLAPSKNHIPVVRYLSPKEFSELEDIARLMGIKKVIAAPLARSSYKADILLNSCV
jgi:lipoic acid synthetase